MTGARDPYSNPGFSHVRGMEGHHAELLESFSFPYGAPVEEARAAREAAVKLLWEKRSVLAEYSEEIVDDVLAAALPHFRFYPLGDNHHNAGMCPYCSSHLDDDKPRHRS